MDSEAEWIDLNTGSTRLLAMRLRKASYLPCVIVNSPENSIDDSTSIISYRVGVRIKWVNICQALRKVPIPRQISYKG